MDDILYPFISILIKNKSAVYRILGILIVASFGFLFFPVFNKNIGNLAWLLLLVILFLSPVSKITQSRALSSLIIFRREAGITMSVLALEHFILYFIKYQEQFNVIFSSRFWIQNGKVTYLAFGMLAFLATIPLFATSNNFSIKILKAKWKTLHWLAYILFGLVALHVIFLKQSYLKVFVVIFSYGLLKLIATLGFGLTSSGEKNDSAVSI